MANTNTASHVVHTFSPVYDQHSKILILGTFPSVKSREGEFYYHHPQNRFWKVLSRLFEEELPQTIPEKKQMLYRHGTAVWDVVKSCDIVGSSDASIRNMQPNDLSVILEQCGILQIFTNGNKAQELYMQLCYPKTGRESIRLPSTSPANAAFSLDRLVDIWGAALSSYI